MYRIEEQLPIQLGISVPVSPGILIGTIHKLESLIGVKAVLSEASAGTGLTLVLKGLVKTASDIYLEVGASSPPFMYLPASGQIGGVNTAPGIILGFLNPPVEVIGGGPVGIMAPIPYDKLNVYLVSAVGTVGVSARVFGIYQKSHPNL